MAITSADVASAAARLAPGDAALLAILATHPPRSLSAWADEAQRLGFCTPAGKAYVASSIRPVFDRLCAMGFAGTSAGSIPTCGIVARGAIWRWAASRPELRRTLDSARQVAVLGAERCILYGSAPRLTVIELLVERDPLAAEVLAVEATCARDDAWLGGLDAALRARLLELALVHVEHVPTAPSAVYEYVVEDAARLAALSPRGLDAFAGVALLRGDFVRVRQVIDLREAHPSAGALRAALAFAQGRQGELRDGARDIGAPERGAHLGVVALLATIALRVEGETARMEPWLRAGKKRDAPMGPSFTLLDALVARKQPRPLPRVGDSCDLLVSTLAAMSVAQESPIEVHHIAQRLQEAVAPLARSGMRWLADQHAFGACLLAAHLGPRFADTLRPVPSMPASPIAPSMFGAKSAREPWELDLARLEALAAITAEPKSRPGDDAGERIVWRALGSSLSIEPHLQKRGASGAWTTGRKLAIKHLLADAKAGGGGSGLSLPPEDRAVARYAREVREGGGYYMSVYHVISREAWTALIGHPRVTDEAGHPLEVVRGEPKVVTNAQPGGVNVRLEPPLTEAGVQPVRRDRQIVVYDVPADKKALFAALSKTTFVADAGRERLSAFLERIARVATVETAEVTAAHAVAADPTIHVRLIAGKGATGGLSVSLLVRPLGPGTPALTAASGEGHVVARVGSATHQAERDLDEERRRADEVVSRCSALGGAETGTHAWRLDAAEDGLAVLAALQELGDRIVVEWPHGEPVRLRPRASRARLRGKISARTGSFWLQGELQIDDDLSVDLVKALELIAAHPGRFIPVGANEYVELTQDLRDVLAGIAAARDPRASAADGVSVSSSAISVIEALTEEGSAVIADAETARWRERLDDAFRRAAAVPKTFQGELRDYQIEGYRWLSRLAHAGLGACLADDMGLGKTVQVIALLLQRASSGPALVVAPTSVCEGWRREIERFAPSLTVRVAFGTSRAGAMEGWKRRQIVITSYTLLQQDAAAFHAIEWATVVLDEAQLVKNAETLRAKAALGLRAQARIVATGTPVENHAGDLYSLFQFLNPGLLGTQKSFLAKVGAEGHLTRATKRLVQPFILRRTKAEVLDDLPPITEIQRNVELSAAEAKLYDAFRKSALAKLAGGGAAQRIQIFAELTRLRRLCCHPGLVAPEADIGSSKLESFVELAQELVDAGHRALVFSQFTDVLALVKPLLDARGIRFQYLDGSTPIKQRAAAVDAFQAGEGEVFLISLKAGGFGLNLTAADYVVHLDPWWNPAVEAQASDRAHRIGQTRPVTVYRLVTVGTIEERIVALHRDKRDLAAAVLEDTDRSAKLSASEMRALLEA